MGWSCGENGKESRCPENREKREAIKAEIAMGDCIKRDLERMGEVNKSNM